MIARFKAAFGRALPDLPAKELSWRLHFIMGALSYTLAGTDALRLIAELTPAETGNDEVLLQRLAPFLLAGLQSPLFPTPPAVDADSRPRRMKRPPAHYVRCPRGGASVPSDGRAGTETAPSRPTISIRH